MPDKGEIGTNYETISSVILCRLTHVLCFGSANHTRLWKLSGAYCHFDRMVRRAGWPHPALFPADISRSGILLLHVDILPKSGSYSCRMPTRDDKEKDRMALLQGTLDLLILRTLMHGPQHGQGIARTIKLQSEDELLVDHGSLYPALQRLETRGWIVAEWGVSNSNRKARFYKLTRQGRQQLTRETDQWHRLAAAIGRILGPQKSEV
jgi:PadR family transcriptional regulator, regulatory protein PadR